jgi:hypothetical protein
MVDAAFVRWSAGHDFGVKFVALEPLAQGQLTNYIEAAFH